MSFDGSTLTRKLCDVALLRYLPQKGRWHYEDGLMLKAFEAACRHWGDRRFSDAIHTWGEAAIRPDGSIVSYRREEYNLDQINPGKALFFLFDESGDPRYRVALKSLREQLARQPRTDAGGFWHKNMYPHQMWLDGLYMQGPFYAEYAARFGPAEDFADIVKQYELAESNTRDGITGLLHHAWDESRTQAWADSRTGRSPHFWSRAMGWYGMALVDLLDFLPESHRGRAGIINTLTRYADALRVVQDRASDMWFQVLDQGIREGNYLETSGSAMFVYTFAKAVRRGYLPTEPYLTISKAGFRSISERMISTDSDGFPSLAGICSVAGLGGNPYRDGSFQYYVSEPQAADDYKGLGPYILAGIELDRINHD
ncbi:MAG: hypothetical protein A2Y38_23085 [Spirochaetes bacterium GWB1_59_5]|nr:MAG: hypothetical protein A2Y38_23085 [Spirochaetes bacterium GWB1_59_5]